MPLMRPDTTIETRSTYMMADGDNLLRLTWEGSPGDCVTNFEKRLKALVNRWPTAKKFLVWDGANADTFRQSIFPEYKAHRPPTPDSYLFLRKNAPKLAAKVGWQSYRCDYAEADDVLGSLCRSALKTGSLAVIISGDKDLYQLLTNENVQQIRSFSTLSGDLLNVRRMTAAELKSNYGTQASQWPLFRALVGDKSDGIPGVEDIGDRTVVGMFRDCPGLTAENISEVLRYDALPSVPVFRKEKIKAAVESGLIEKFLQLTTLRKIPRGDLERIA